MTAQSLEEAARRASEAAEAARRAGANDLAQKLQSLERHASAEAKLLRQRWGYRTHGWSLDLV